MLDALKHLARAGLTVAIRTAIHKGLQQHPTADLRIYEDRKAVAESILLAIAETSEMTTDTVKQVLATGFDETAPNPFMETD